MREDLERGQVVKELIEIRDKLLQLAAAQENAADFREELSGLARRIEGLISVDEGPEAGPR